MRPRLSRVGSHIERQIPEQAHSAIVSVIAQLAPLGSKRKLFALHSPELLVQLGTRAFHSLRLAIAQLRRPSPPWSSAVTLTERLIEGVVPQPVLRFVQERFEVAAAALGPLLRVQQCRIAREVRADPVG